MVRTCTDCSKRRGGHCAVLLEMIGRRGECWAWSDDADWEIKVIAAVAAYKLELVEKYAADDVPGLLAEDTRKKVMARPKRISKNWHKT